MSDTQIAPANIPDLVEALGGTHVLGAALGVSVQAICNMRTRGAIPPRHWPTLIRLASENDVPGVTLDLLVGIACPSTSPREEAA